MRPRRLAPLYRSRVTHAAAAVVLVSTTVTVVAFSAARPVVNRVVSDLFSTPIHPPPWSCKLGPGSVPRRRVLILYDSTGRFAAYGAQTGVFAANFASHFARPVRQPVKRYRRGEMRHFAAVIYVGINYGEHLPAGFLADARAGVRPVLWLGENAYQLTDRAYARAHGWRATGTVTRHFTTVRYRNVNLTTHARTLDRIRLLRPSRARVLGTAQTASGSSVPWAVRSGRLTYVAEASLDSEGSEDRSFAVADLMAGLFGPVPQRHRALIRLEDVGPEADPVQLRQVANFLASRHVPFTVAAYPLYLGPAGQQPRKRISLTGNPAVDEAIKYMLSKGGTLALHGYTHQLGAKHNPNNGESGEDFEFYRVHYNAGHKLIYDGPTGRYPAVWARHRIAEALAAVRAAGLPRPEIWQFPEYGASPAAYRVAASMFVARFERVSYAAGPPGHENLKTLTEQMPPFLVRDVYGGPVLPETLGYVQGADESGSGAGSVRQILAAAAAQKGAVRDNVAGVYYHPFLGVGPLRSLVDGIQREGYKFVTDCNVLRG